MEISINTYRQELLEFVSNKKLTNSRTNTYQKQGKELLKLSDEALDRWRKEHAPYSYVSYVFNSICKKNEGQRYKRLVAKSQSLDFEEWSESEEEFISLYEEENQIVDSIL